MPTKVKQMQEISEWSRVFPPKIDTKSLSCVFMKKLFAVALSNVLYLRRIFPERAFKDKQIEGLVIKILKNEGEFPPAERLINWARGCFDAMEKGYLKTVIVGIHNNPEDLDTAIESYSFRFSYSESENDEDSVGVDINTQTKIGKKKDFSKKYATCNVKETTLSLLRTLILASKTMGALPTDVFLTMKLLYYDEVTPPEYEPPCFRPADYSSFRYLSETMSLLVGNVETAYHNMQLKLKTDKETFVAHMSELKNREMAKAAGTSATRQTASPGNFSESHENTPTSVSLTGLDKEEGEERESGGAFAPLEMASPSSSAAATPGLTSKLCYRSQLSTSAAGDGSDGEDYEVRCPCRFTGDDGIMIICDHCRKWQHALCFGIIDEACAPQSHICDVCAKQQPQLIQKGITDPTLLPLTDDDKMITCVYRRILMMCKQVGSDVSLTPKEISRQLGVEIGVCQGLASRLKNEGILISTGTSRTRRSTAGSNWKISRDVLESAMASAFKTRSPEPQSQCVTIGMDMGKHDMELQKAEELLSETHLTLGGKRSNHGKRNKRQAPAIPKSDNENVSPVAQKKKKVSVVRTPQHIF